MKWYTKQRPGGRKRWPTLSEDGDRLYIRGKHKERLGDAVKLGVDGKRIVLAPGSGDEAYKITAPGVHSGNSYQVKVGTFLSWAGLDVEAAYGQDLTDTEWDGDMLIIDLSSFIKEEK